MKGGQTETGNEIERMTTKQTKKVYLDQNALSKMALESSSKGYRSIFSNDSVAEVWASPTNVIETVLCSEFGKVVDASMPQKRQQIALTLLGLIDDKRLLPEPAFLLVDEFLGYLQELVPGAVVDLSAFNRKKELSQSTFLAIVRELSCNPNAPLDPKMVEMIKRAKLSTKLKFYEMARDPDVALARLMNQDRSTDNWWIAYDKLSIEELNQSIMTLGEKLCRAKGKTLQRLQKHRESFVAERAGDELVTALNSIIDDSTIFESTFDSDTLLKLNDRNGLPPNVVSVKSHAESARDIVIRLARYTGAHILPLARVMQEIAWAELESTLRAGGLVSEGTTFDADHASAVLNVEIFVTGDSKLAATLRTSVKKLILNRQVFIVKDTRGLRNALGKTA